MSRRVAVIDIGSNSIKSLLATEGPEAWQVIPLLEETREVRLSKGIHGTPPMLQGDVMQSGIQAIKDLWLACTSSGKPDGARIVATAAVRMAANGDAFLAAVESATGIRPEILTGVEEAAGIARGVLTDPRVRSCQDAFTLFDLGGGSMEVVRYDGQKVTRQVSMPIGAVKLTEQFVTNPSIPIPQSERDAVLKHVRFELGQIGFPIESPLVGCSGGLTTLRATRAREERIPMEKSSPVFTRSYLEALGQQTMDSDVQTRIEKLNLAPARADIFPTAFLVFQVLLDLSGAECLLHSLHNLRFGLARSLLDSL